jgi:D-alanyl-D-alanine dipeptidase
MRCELIAGHPDFRALSSISGIAVDLRYATDDNFVGRNLYGSLDCAWLHSEAAAAVERTVEWLGANYPGLRLAVLDALRPHRVQIELWDFLEGTELRQYLADPAKGSIHSFGMAVDVTLLDAQGAELDMGTPFDALSILSHPQHEAEHLQQGLLTELQLANRHVLYRAMQHGGFVGIASEWWHFDCGDRLRVRQTFTRIE